jgi:hypothetical protein
MSATESTNVESFGGAYVEGEVNTVGGDFVGRDKRVFAAPPRIVDDESLLLLQEQIQRLRGRITRLIPVAEAIAKIHQQRYGAFWKEPSITMRWFKVEFALENRGMTLLNELNDIEAGVSSDNSPDQARILIQKLSTLSDVVSVEIARRNMDFKGYVHAAAATIELFQSMLARIGHKELRETADSHFAATGGLWRQLDSAKLTAKGFDVLSDEASAALNILLEIENRKEQVAQLIRLDQRRRKITVTAVIAYIGNGHITHGADCCSGWQSV